MFYEIGLVDELGSGMRNTNKYTKLYSGGTPSFDEGDIFKIALPLKNIATAKVGPEKKCRSRCRSKCRSRGSCFAGSYILSTIHPQIGCPRQLSGM